METENIKRYIRQIQLEGFGLEAQQRLLSGKVLIIGAGGLGNPVSMYLASSGIGYITIMDQDKVEESNLHRQPLFSFANIGQAKADLVKQSLKRLNPTVQVHAIEERFSDKNSSIVATHDLIIDCTDNFESRYLISDACVKYGKAFVFGAVEGWSGQVSVFNYLFPDGKRSPSYRELFSDVPEDKQDCNSIGVLGTAPAVIGSIMAHEAVKCLTGAGENLAGKLLVYDFFYGSTNTVEYFKPGVSEMKAKALADTEITADTLVKFMDNFQLVDIRDEYEFDTYNEGGINMPYYSLLEKDLPEFSKEIVLVCESGNKSRILAEHLKKKNITVKSLRGGIEALIQFKSSQVS